MNHIEEYKIVTANSTKEIEHLVNEYLKEGWILNSELKVVSSTERIWFQTMIKLKEYPEFKTSKYID